LNQPQFRYRAVRGSTYLDATAARPPRLSREFIARHQRARIVAALAEETMARGYRA